MLMISIPLWITEFVPPDHRGALANIHAVMINCGYLLSAYCGVGFYCKFNYGISSLDHSNVPRLDGRLRESMASAPCIGMHPSLDQPGCHSFHTRESTLSP